MELKHYIKAMCPLIYIRTSEFERALASCLASLENLSMKDATTGERVRLCRYLWKASSGFRSIDFANVSPSRAITTDFTSTIRYIYDNKSDLSNTVFFFIDPFPFLNGSPALVQMVRDLVFSFKTSIGSYLVFIAPYTDIPQNLLDVMTIVDFPLPTKQEILKLYMNSAKAISAVYPDIGFDSLLLQKAAEFASGLSEFKAQQAFALSVASKRRLDLEMIREAKSEMLKQTEALEAVDVDTTMDDLGGFAVLKKHVSLRKKYFDDPFRAKKFGIFNPPKGIFLVGLPGTGKTTAAKCIASELGLPLYKFDIGGLFKGIVGSSEAETRKVLKILEAVAPAVLLLDEFEKAISGLKSSGRTDSGVTSRVVGTLLSWMQESKVPIYKVAACNTLSDIDASVIRRGRWDAVFYVDLPTYEERKQIFSIHLRKRNFDVNKFDLEALAEASSGFVGSEIESAIEEAAFVAFSEERDLVTEDIVNQSKIIVPISVADKEAIDKFRSYVKGKAINVSEAGHD